MNFSLARFQALYAAEPSRGIHQETAMDQQRKAQSARIEAPHVHQLGDWMVNFYLVADGSGITVVDAGLPTHYPQLTPAGGQLGPPTADVRPVTITPAH